MEEHKSLKKAAFIIIIGLFLTSFCSGFIDDESASINGDAETLFLFFGDTETSFYSNYEPPATPATPAISGGGGGPTGYEEKSYYDVIIEDLKKSYAPEAEITFRIKIVNQGDVSDSDAILTYKLIDPSGKTHDVNRETFKEVEVTCQEGSYNILLDSCVDGMSITEAHPAIFEKNVRLPTNTTLGEWRVQVEYETTAQPLITVYKTFHVRSGFEADLLNNLPALLLISVILFLIIIIAIIIMWIVSRRR